MARPYRTKTQRADDATSLMRIDASYGHPSDGVAVPKRVRKRKPIQPRIRPIKVCICGCKEEFVAYRDNQQYKRGHYRLRYVSHSCPDCGAIHLRRIT